MTDHVERTLQRLASQLSGGLSLPGDNHYAAATAIWSKPVGRVPRAVAHCRTAADVQAAIRAARDCYLSLSVRGGGHDWTGRALCNGLTIDLGAMKDVVIAADRHSAQIGGGALAADAAAATDPLHLAPVMGAVGVVGVAGLTLGGGYGTLIGRCGLTLDNLLGAEVVLADGRIVTANHDTEAELYWALRGGGGNFGVVTAMQHRLHDLPSIQAGLLIYPFAEAKAVLERCVEAMAGVPEELSVQVGFVTGPDGVLVVFVAPAWCGAPAEGAARVAPFLKLGTLLGSTVSEQSYGESLRIFGGFEDRQRVFMETSWLPALDSGSIDALIGAMEIVVSPGCAIVTHEFKGAATRVPVDATAFGLRRDHVLIEIVAAAAGQSGELEAERHRLWAHTARLALGATALPGGYPNLLAGGDDRAAKSYGPNLERLLKAKRHYDPDNLFSSAIPLPVG